MIYITLAAGACIIVIPVIMIIVKRMKLASYRKAEGVVTNVKIAGVFGFHNVSTRRFVYVSFTVDGEKYKTNFNDPFLKPGQKVTVLYNPEHPNHEEVLDTIFGKHSDSVIAFFIGILIVLATLWVK